MTNINTYGTRPPMNENQGIKMVRNLANDYLLGNLGSVFITSHANIRMGQRKILPDEAIGTISSGFYVEYQNVKGNPKKSDCTVFYSGHSTQILSVNTIADIIERRITLVTVEHFDEKVWKVVGDYIERK